MLIYLTKFLVRLFYKKQLSMPCHQWSAFWIRISKSPIKSHSRITELGSWFKFLILGFGIGKWDWNFWFHDLGLAFAFTGSGSLVIRNGFRNEIPYLFRVLGKWFKINSMKVTEKPMACSAAPSEDPDDSLPPCFLIGWRRCSNRRRTANEGGVATMSSDEN